MTQNKVAHILGVAHSVTSHDPHYNPTDAFVTCTIYLARLLHKQNYKVYIYGVEGSMEPACTEVVPVVSRNTYERVYGQRDDSKLNRYNDATNDAWTEFTANCTTEIAKRKHNHLDLILPMFGHAHKTLTDILQDKEGFKVVIEPCIGHPGSYADFKVFSSYAWWYYQLGVNKQENGHAYHCVIPHFVDTQDYPLCTQKDQDYAVYLGRIQPDKGVSIAIDATRELGIKLIVIGNGSLDNVVNLQKTNVDHVTHLGVLTLQEKLPYLQKARCVFVPTLYIEPFSLACLEAQMCGTPCVVSRWGGPSEIVIHGKTGFHCDTLATYIKGCQLAITLCPKEIRNSVMARFSIEAVADLFVDYFTKIQRFINKEAHFYTPIGGFQGMGKLANNV